MTLLKRGWAKEMLAEINSGDNLPNIKVKPLPETGQPIPEIQFKFRQDARRRNQPCECGSGIKYKKCCWNKKVEKTK